MKAELRDERTLVIEPETVAEQEILKRLAGLVLEVEEPRPFQPNVAKLVAIVPKEARA